MSKLPMRSEPICTCCNLREMTNRASENLCYNCPLYESTPSSILVFFLMCHAACYD